MHWLFNKITVKYINQWAKDSTTRTPEQICDEMKNHFTSFGVQCFMKKFETPLAWAHYASSHKGFCIEYDFKAMTFAKKNSNLAQNHVNYVSELPEICLSELLFSPHQALGKFTATKSVDWSYEQELRLVNFEKKATSIDMPEGLKIKKLIAGHKMSVEHKQRLKDVAETLQVEYDEMAITREGLTLSSSVPDWKSLPIKK